MADTDFSPLEQQVIALAGVAQAARLVDQVSRTGSYPQEFFEASINSLFQFDAETAVEVFDGLPRLRLGLDNLSRLLASDERDRQGDMVRYVFGILYLERKFAADSEMMSVVHSRLQHTSYRAEHFTSHITELCQSVSGIYQDTLSQLRYRIKVTGAAQHLHEPRNADIVRALLLAGIRAAFLWRQLGGRRWKLLVGRKRLLRTAQQLSHRSGLV